MAREVRALALLAALRSGRGAERALALLLLRQMQLQVLVEVAPRPPPGNMSYLQTAMHGAVCTAKAKLLLESQQRRQGGCQA